MIRTYNRRSYVEECVRSVLQQTRPADEVIVVDDGSSDGTAHHLRSAFPQILVVEQPNLGRSIATNHGVAVAKCEWICLLDDDDLWHRDKLATVDRYLSEHPECHAVNHPLWTFAAPEHRENFYLAIDFVASGLDDCHEAARTATSRNDASYLHIRGRSFAELLRRNAGAYSASVIHRDAFISAGCVPASFSYADDWLLFINLARITEWHTIDERLAFYRVHSAQSTAGDNLAPILASHVAVWFGGRPFPERKEVGAARAQLRLYQHSYRVLVQQLLWQAVWRRDWATACEIRRLGRTLIVGPWNWVYVHLPPPLTWRLQLVARRVSR